MLKILTEASGSLTSAYLIKAIKDAGFLAIGSDIDSDSVGRFLADEFITVPRKDDPNLWPILVKLLLENKIDIVLPSLDETLAGWAERKDEMMEFGTRVIISDYKTVQTFTDKWMTYLFFRDTGIPTPRTSLKQDFPLVKPRKGRGAVGVKVVAEPLSMEGMISQELITGEEYTVDVFCDIGSRPVYIVPRKRIGVRDGKSTGGVVVHHPEIIKFVKRICSSIDFLGPLNIQCFVCTDGSVKFIEINPRIAGGMALGFAATENWVRLMVEHFVEGRPIRPKPIQYGMKMKRYYAEVFIP